MTIMLDFIKDLVKIFLSALFIIVTAFSAGTAAAAIVCWYYEIPIGFCILGGILVLGLALALMPNSIFDI